MPEKIKLELKSYDCSDLPVFIDKWSPENSEDVYIGVNLTIGESGCDGGSNYQCMIATPNGLKRVSSQLDDFNFDSRAILIVKTFCWEKIKRHFKEVIKKCEDETLVDSQWKLQRYFQWEYEDYIEEKY